MDMLKKIKPHISLILTVLKYVFSLVLTILAYTGTENNQYLTACLLELLIIFILSNILMKRKAAGRIVNTILLLMYNAQMAVLYFGSSYITMVMLTNIPSLKAISGRAGTYITGVIIILIFTCIPIKRIEIKKVNGFCLLSIVLCIELLFTMFFGNGFSPLYGYCILGIQHHQKMELIKEINEAVVEDVDYTYDEVAGYVEKEDDLPEQPNIILIFTEGLSQHIIDDERNIMPNVAEYQEKSLRFMDYYNHTFATYRGIIGQLYSGYQLNDFDKNGLVSLQSILSDEGYETSFINTEPMNKDFSNYLKNMGFDNVIGSKKHTGNGEADTISDKDAYELLYETAIKQSKKEEPFFISIYTFGTHASLNSPDEKFGNGDVAELNKFYNVDYQFGEFMDKFNNSSLKEDTIVIFTSDHATFQDDAFNGAFPGYARVTTSVDEIPLFFYYDGMEPGSIGVDGRNSVNLTPTILDYLDISAGNYFLGTSLFSGEAAGICETSYSDSHVIYTTRGGSISTMVGEELDSFKEELKEYYIIKNSAEGD